MPMLHDRKDGQGNFYLNLCHCESCWAHLQEPGMQGSLCDVKHLRAVNTAIVIHLLDEETIGEGRDVQHVEERGLAGTNLVTSLDKTDITLEK